MIKVCLLGWIVLLSMASLSAQSTDFQDLRGQWQTYSLGEYRSYDENSSAESIYIPLKPSVYSGKKLIIASGFGYFVFLNGRIIGEYKGQTEFNLDSLANVGKSSDLLITVFQRKLSSSALITKLKTTPNDIHEI